MIQRQSLKTVALANAYVSVSAVSVRVRVNSMPDQLWSAQMSSRMA